MKFTELLYVLNHSINFLLYTVTRHSFRKVLKEQLKFNCFKIFHIDLSHRYNNTGHSKGITSRRFNIPNRFLNNSNKTEAAEAPINKQVTVKLSNQSPVNNPNTALDYESYWETMPLSEPPFVNGKNKNSDAIDKKVSVDKNKTEKKGAINLRFFKKKKSF